MAAIHDFSDEKKSHTRMIKDATFVVALTTFFPDTIRYETIAESCGIE